MKIETQLSGEEVAEMPRVGETVVLRKRTVEHLSDGLYLVTLEISPLSTCETHGHTPATHPLTSNLPGWHSP